MAAKTIEQVAADTGLSEDQLKRKYPFSFGRVQPAQGTFQEGMAQAFDLGTDVAPVIGTAKAAADLPEDLQQVQDLISAGYDEGDIKKMGLGGAYAALTFMGFLPGVKAGTDIAKKGIKEGVKGAAEETVDQTARAFNLRKDAKLQIDNPGFDEVYQETYAETKQRASDRVKNEAIEAGRTDTYEANIGTAGGITGYANDVKFDPKELKDLPGAMGEEKFRSNDGYGKLELLEKSIAEKGYKPYNILIHVREDGQPFIVEGNHRLAEALKSGRETIVADVRYLRGAEEKEGPLDPRRIFPDMMPNEAPAPRIGYDPNDTSSRVFHLTKADFDTVDVVGQGGQDIGFHVGTAEQATARGSTNISYSPREFAEEMAKGERILPMVLKRDLKPARIVDMSKFAEPKNWLANLSVPSSDLERIRFLKGDEADAALFAKAPTVKVGGEIYTMLPDAMRAGMDENLWRDLVLEAHRAKRIGLDTMRNQEDRIAWFNTLKDTANKHGYDSFVYRNEYEGTANDNLDALIEQIERANRGEIDPAEIDMNSRFADSYMLLEPNQVKGLFGGMTESSPEYMKNKGGLMLQKGGAVPMKEQMELFADGGLEQDGGTTDPVSGNDVPVGSSQEEVRDDIPAQLSEGEFVFPADVVRYIGLEKLMQMRQEAKMGLKMMEEMGQMGNSDEATIPDDLPFAVTDLIIVDGPEGVDSEDKKEYNIGGMVPQIPPGIPTPREQGYGVTYQAPQFQAGQTQVGMAASPVEMAPVSRPVQQETPVYQPPETLPAPGEFLQPPEGQAPQTITIVNEETGEERMITFIPGVTEIPQGFVRKEDYVPKEVVPETETTTVETARVREEDPTEKPDDGLGPGGGRVGVGGFSDGTGRKQNATIMGVSFSMGEGFMGGAAGAAATGFSLALGKPIPAEATATFTYDNQTYTVSGTEYNNLKESGYTGDLADKIVASLKTESGIARNTIEYDATTSTFKDKKSGETFQDKDDDNDGIGDILNKAGQSIYSKVDKDDLVGSAQKMNQSEKDIASAFNDAQFAAFDFGDDDNSSSSGSGQSFSSGQSFGGFDDVNPDDPEAEGDFNTGGLASKKKPKAKKMKRGGLASKK